MSRRDSSRSRRSISLNSQRAVIEAQLSTVLYSWIRADTRTESGGKVTQFNDRVAPGTGIRAITAAHALTQAVVGQQAVTPTATATLGNQLAANLVRASAVYYDSNSPASSWRCMHDGTGMEFWLVNQPTSDTGVQVTLATRNAGTGINLIRNAGGVVGQTSLYNLNGGSFVIQVDVGAAGWANGAGTYRSARYATADTPDYTVTSRAVTIASGNELSAPAAGDPAIALRLGSDGANHADMMFADLLIYKGAPSATVRALVARYILSRYGIS